jgi:hypothetical protein
MENLPLSVSDLLAKLDEEIPEVNPKPTDSIDRLMYQAGRRSVVLYLKSLQHNSLDQFEE